MYEPDQAAFRPCAVAAYLSSSNVPRTQSMWHCAFETGERSSSWRFPVRPTKRRSICCATLRHSPRRSTHVSNERNSPEREVYPAPSGVLATEGESGGRVVLSRSGAAALFTYPTFHVKHGLPLHKNTRDTFPSCPGSSGRHSQCSAERPIKLVAHC